MKTKNILKIAIFSIALFALLISPVLKSNSFQVRANGEVLKTTQEIESSLVDKNALTICQVDTDKWIVECKKNHNDFLCEAQGSFILSWCEIVKGTLEGFGKMFAGLINLEIDWILKALDPDIYGKFATNEGVIAIWIILRNIVNSLLVLGLIGIAIATILGYKKYAWKQVLWKLILVALLVNFSLVISGMVVDISNYLAGYFLSMSQENNESIAPRIMKGYGYTKVANTTTDQYDPPYIFGEDKYKTTQIVQDEDAKKEVDKYTLGFGNFFIITFIMILVGGFAVIALLAIFLTVVVRNFLLIVLLGLSPIAFAAWVFPDTEKYWKMWWSNFIKWCFFPTIFAFTLFLALTVMNNMPSIGTESPMAVTIVRMVLFSMFLVGGLIFSIQSGGVVSKTVMQQSSKIGAAAGGFVSKKTSGAITESSTYKKAGKFLTKVPLLGGVGQEMMVAGEKAKAGRVKEHEKNLENVGLGNLKALEEAKAPSPLDRNAYERRVALTNKLADMGELGPHHFKLEKGQLLETGDTIENKVEALSRIKPDKIRDKTQTSDFIKDIVKEKEDEAKKQGKSEQEIKDAGNKVFDETIQEIAKKLSPAQLAGWWEGVSPKDMVEGQWGGPEGKIAQAIKKDGQAKKKFYDEAIPSSTVLRAASGISVKKEKEKQNKEPKETPPSPGWTKQGRIWRP